MTCYVAARYTDKARARMVRATLVNAGFPVASRWLYGSTTAQEDLDDVRQSDVLVLVQPRTDPEIGCGRYIETGYALARRMPVLVWAEVWDEAFDFWCRVPPVTVYGKLPDLVTALAAVAFRLIEGPIA